MALLLLAAALTGCDEGSSDSRASSSQPALATEPVDLAPGQTQAQVAWEPSLGRISGYLVFSFRNSAPLAFEAQTTEPFVEIQGNPGDVVQIVVVAVSESLAQSEASPASVPIRFHAAPEPALAVAQTASVPQVAATPLASAPEAITAAPSDTPAIAPAIAASTPSTASPAPTEVEPLADRSDPMDQTDTDAATPSRLSRSLRARLLASNARLPYRDPSQSTQSWIQSFVDDEFAAGVALVGTGDLDGDDLLELVWQDPAGQLFFSIGSDIADSEDLSTTFHDGVRLRPTERFGGLADFDGDGVGDWLIEDAVTRSLWIIPGAAAPSLEASSLPAVPEPHPSDAPRISIEIQPSPDYQFVGYGEFDQDGRSELLWQLSDGSFAYSNAVGTSNAEGTVPLAFSPLSPHVDPQHEPAWEAPDAVLELLAIADLDADGRDDLIARDGRGQLHLALLAGAAEDPDRVSNQPAAIHLQWVRGPVAPTSSLALVATLDLDHDGTIQLAWRIGNALEIWDAREGPRARFDF